MAVAHRAVAEAGARRGGVACPDVGVGRLPDGRYGVAVAHRAVADAGAGGGGRGHATTCTTGARRLLMEDLEGGRRLSGVLVENPFGEADT